MGRAGSGLLPTRRIRLPSGVYGLRIAYGNNPPGNGGSARPFGRPAWFRLIRVDDRRPFDGGGPLGGVGALGGRPSDNGSQNAERIVIFVSAD